MSFVIGLAIVIMIVCACIYGLVKAYPDKAKEVEKIAKDEVKSKVDDILS